MMLSLLRRGTVSIARHTPPTRLVPPVSRLPSSIWRLLSTEPPKEPPQPIIKDLPKKKAFRGENRTPISWKSLGVAAVTMGFLVTLLWDLKKKRKEEIAKKKVFSIGKAAIGGDFELVDTANKVVSLKDFSGKWVLIYFGFTNCPDICPEELEKMSEVIKYMDKTQGTSVFQPLFISVDPERDTPELIAKYVVDFHPRLRGLTGTVDQIKDICKKYRIYYSAGPKEDGDYIVDHTIIMYLLDPNGEFQQYYGRNKTAIEIAKDITVRMKEFAKNE